MIFLWATFISLSLAVHEPLVLVNGGSTHYQREREAAREWNRRRVSNEIIFAPLEEDTKVITKEKMYINMDEYPEDIYTQLLEGRPLPNTLDDFFVTSPPARTTLATSDEDDVIYRTTTQPSTTSSTTTVASSSADVGGGSTSHLKLVTLPPLTTTPLPPFKYQKKRENSLLNMLPWNNMMQSSMVRFPAQPWQIPPRNPGQLNHDLGGLFEVTPPSLLPPANPFRIGPPPPPPQPLNLTYPFIPIGINSPPPTPPPVPSFIEYPFVPSHKSPLRVGFSPNRQLPAIPLPGQFDDQDIHLKSSNKPITDFSIDDRPTLLKVDQQFAPNAKVFVTENKYGREENMSEHLRTFVKTHPNLVNSLQKPPKIIHRGEMTKKSTSGPPSSRPTVAPVAIQPAPSMLTANQKLDLCCRKQQVSIICQSFCNFDTFSDKTLTAAFLTNQCPGPQLGKAYDCASSKADHSTCCQNAGLHNFLGGRCMPFCRTHMATPANVLDYLPCLQVFETIKNCYRDYQVHNRNIFGD